MAISARLPFAARRFELCLFTIIAKGVDLTNENLGMQVRLSADTPGAPILDLGNVSTAAAEGLKLENVEIISGVPVSTISGRINKSSMSVLDGLARIGEPGVPSRFEYAIRFGEITRLSGPFYAVPGVFDSDSASPSGEYSGGVQGAVEPLSSISLTISDKQVVEVKIDGADLVGTLVAKASDSAIQATEQAALSQSAALVAQQFALSVSGQSVAAEKLNGSAGFCIDAEALKTSAVAVAGGGKDFNGSARDWLPADIFAKPKLVTNEIGATVWSAHNAIYSSEDPTNGDWIRNQIETPAAIETAIGTMFRLQANGGNGYLTTSDINLNNVVSGSEAQQTDAALVGPSTTGLVVLGRNANGSAVWFDLLNGVVLSATGGLTGVISRVNPDGTLLPPGVYLCSVSGPIAAHRLAVAPVDQDGSWATTSGSSVLFAKPRGHLGSTPLDYIARGAYVNPSNPPISSAMPYDWSRTDSSGARVRRILVEAPDGFALTSTILPDVEVIYIEADVEATGSNAQATIIEASGGGAIAFLAYDRTGNLFPDPYLNFTVIQNGTTPVLAGVIGDVSNSQSLALGMNLQDGKIMLAVNGDLVTSVAKTAPVVDRIAIAGVGAQPGVKIYLKTLLGFSNAISGKELAALENAQRLHPAVVSSSEIVLHKNNYAADNGTRSREATITLLGEAGDSAFLLVTAHQKWGEAEEAYHVEAPVRLLYRTFEIDAAGAIVSSSEIGVFDQPSGWSVGQGHMLGRIGIKLRTGSRRGQTLCAWAVLSSSNQEFEPVNPHTIYGRFITDNARGPLSPRFEIFTTEAIQLIDPEAQYIIPDPSGSMVEFPIDSPWPGRVVFVAYTNENTNRSFYSDQQGAAGSWQAGGKMPQNSTYGHNESNLVLLPSGWLLNINRIIKKPEGTEPADVRTANISKDGGVTWGQAITMPDFVGAQVSGGIAQIDPDGDTGAFGIVAYARAMALPGLARTGVLISHYEDETLEPKEQFYAQGRMIGNGYTSLVSLFGGRFYALATEIATLTGRFNDDAGSSTFIKIIDPRRGVQENAP